MSTVELVAPGGSFIKAITALRFGADAVYCGLRKFSLRKHSANLSHEEFESLVKIAHYSGKKVYLTLNIFPFDEDFESIEKEIVFGSDIGVDAFVVSDPGIIEMVKLVDPKIEIHLSTQMNTTNSNAAMFWFKSGVSRIILARELSIDRLRKIVSQCKKGEFEVFIHGALCMAYSGRCFISKYLTGRDANRGDCTHSCRWEYLVEEVSRNGLPFPVIEEKRGTRIFFAHDLCTLEILHEIIGTGVQALKIEGRMKSMYYVAVTTNIYRQVIECLEKSPALIEEKIQDWLHELALLSDRGYTVGFIGGDPWKVSNFRKDGQEEIKPFLGYFGKKQGDFVSLFVRNTFEKGVPMEVYSPNCVCDVELIDILDEKEKNTTIAHSGRIYKVRTNLDYVNEGDLLRIKIKKGAFL